MNKDTYPIDPLQARPLVLSALAPPGKETADNISGISENGAVDSSAGISRPLQEWLTTEEAAQYLRVSNKRLLNLCSNGRVPFYKFGRSNRFLRNELRDLLLAQRKGGTAWE